MNLCIVTATTNPTRADACFTSWGKVPSIRVTNGVGDLPYLGTVPAFRTGVDIALQNPDVDLIACLHDDLEILDPDWAIRVERFFSRMPQVGLAGFGGAIALGDDDLYQKPYSPIQLARKGFRSNLVDAEVHGMRSLLSEQVACLDGFSQIGRREFWLGIHSKRGMTKERPLTYLEKHGVIHHFYDSALGCLAARAGWDTWYLPIRCRHYGGQTAVADQGYQRWAKEQIPGGDNGFWEQSHRRGYDLFTDVLPLRV